MPTQYDVRRPTSQQVRITPGAPKAEVRQGFIVDKKPTPAAVPQETAPAQEVAPAIGKYLPWIAGAAVLFLFLGRRK